jgi:hypothetical protein
MKVIRSTRKARRPVIRGPVLLQRPTNPVEALISEAVRKWSSFVLTDISDFEHSLILARIKPWLNVHLE